MFDLVQGPLWLLMRAFGGAHPTVEACVLPSHLSTLESSMLIRNPQNMGRGRGTKRRNDYGKVYVLEPVHCSDTLVKEYRMHFSASQ